MSLNERLTVAFLPEKEPKRALGSISAFQQMEELRQLASLTASAEAETFGVGGNRVGQAGDGRCGPVGVLVDSPGQLLRRLRDQERRTEWTLH